MWTLDLTLLLTIGLLLFVGLKSHWTARLLVLLMLSPVLRYGTTLFGFPIRLALSDWAGQLLRLAGLDVQTVGNTLAYNGVEMAVDPACMGLQLTGASLLVAIGWLVWAERQAQKRVPMGWVLVYGGIAFGLTVLCNLFRIILLVVFHIAPADPLHEIMGLVCVAVYTWLPMLALARQFVKRLGRAGWSISTHTFRLAGGLGVFLLSLGIGVGWLTSLPATVSMAQQHRSGFACRQVNNGYLQYSRPGVLIYEKRLTDWWSAEHSPTACWTGSGYALRRVRKTRLGNHPAYVAELSRNGQTLYTAWWISNGPYQTTGQFDFRWRMAKTMGQSDAPVFRLVNVTAGSWGELKKQCGAWE